jgi:TsgA-like MFS transporter
MPSKKDILVDYLKEVPNFLSIFIFGVFFNIASLMLVDMSASTGIETTDLALIFTFFTVGVVIGQLTSTLYNRRFSNIQVIIACLVMLIPLTVGLLFNSSLFGFYAIYLVSGFLLGVVWIQASEFLLKSKIENKDSLMTVHLTFYPIAALVTPLITSAILRNGLSWRYSFYAIIFFTVLTIILYLLLLSRRKGAAEKTEEKRTSLRSIFVDRKKNIVYIMMIVAIFCYVAGETVIATWAPTFFREFRGFDVTSAGFILTLFWLFVIVGRIITIFFTGKVKASKIVIVLSVLAIPAAILFVFLDNKTVIYILTALAGLGFSAMFPLIVSSGSTVYEKGRGILATGLFVSANAGITAAPFVVKLAVRSGYLLSLVISVVFIVIMLVVMVIAQLYYFRKN